MGNIILSNGAFCWESDWKQEFVLVFHFAAGTCTVVVVVVCLFVSYHDYVPQNSIHIQCL